MEVCDKNADQKAEIAARWRDSSHDQLRRNIVC